MGQVRISARNRLPGTIVKIRLGDVVAQVTIKVGRHLVDAVITRDSAEEMGLEKGDRVAAMIKSTEIMVFREDDEA